MTGAVQAGDAGWDYVGGDEGGKHYSTAAQISRGNVSRLDTVWTYSTGDLSRFKRNGKRYKFQTTPILFENYLVFCTPFNDVIALTPDTGKEVWRFANELPDLPRIAAAANCRGVTPWRDEQAEADTVCAARIYMGSYDSRLIALDARTGIPCKAFGENGAVRILPSHPELYPGEQQITSPPVVVADVIIVGTAIGDNMRADAPKGTVYALDVRSGALKWTFNPLESDGGTDERRSGILNTGHANVWSYMSVDHDRSLVFLPTSSPSPDHFGGMRPGENRNANSIVVLNARTGEIVWRFQTVHHDLWDYDLGAQPILGTLWSSGKEVPAVIQSTKLGLIFAFNRETGEPIFPIEERPVPAGDIPGEYYSATQPFPTKPRILVDTTLAPEDAWGLTPFDRMVCRSKIQKLKSDGAFTPPSLEGSLHFPFSGGGINWGGGALDENSQTLFVLTNNVSSILRLIPQNALEDQNPLGVFEDGIGRQAGAPYAIAKPLLRSPLGLPCNPPPWGRIHAIDMKSGSVKWERPIGTIEDFAPFGDLLLPHGTPNMGGPIATAGGLVFVAATMDNYLRAFDAKTGKELWKDRLPAGGQATPMTYEWNGVQYVVIAAGGHSEMRTTPGDTIVAFSLSEKKSTAYFTLKQLFSRPTFRWFFALGAVIVFIIASVLYRIRGNRRLSLF